MESKIIVSLDRMDIGKALTVVSMVKDQVWGFKVSDLFVQHGVQIVDRLSGFGRVMVDLNTTGTPDSTSNTLKRLERVGTTLVTINGAGGAAMIQRAMGAVERTKVLAVTIPTSMSDDEVRRIYNRERLDACKTIAEEARHCGVHGLVMPHDFMPLAPRFRIDPYDPRSRTPLLWVVPAVRPAGAMPGDDQIHVAHPTDLRAASHIIIGRPITNSLDPIKVVRDINTLLSIKSMSKAG